MDVLAIDFESFYDPVDFTLKKLTTSAYVHDSRFEALCLAVYGGKNRKFTLTQDEIRPWIDSLDRNNTTFIAQHAQFDGLILQKHYGFSPAFWIDTLSMSRAVHGLGVRHNLDAQCARYRLPPKTVDYGAFAGKRWNDLSNAARRALCAQCLDDAQRTYLIAQRQIPLLPFEELQVIDMTVRMFTEPMLVGDIARLENLSWEERVKRTEVLESLGLLSGDLASDDKFEKILLDLGEDVVYKPAKNKRGKKGSFAKSDEYMQSLVNSADETISELAQARLLIKSTIQMSRAERLLSAAKRGPLCVYYNYYGARNSRFSGGEHENFQNLPSRGVNGVEIRKSIHPPRDYGLVVADMAQIECRMEMALAGQFDKLQAFRQKRDLYCELATKLFGRPVTKNDMLERQLGKTILLQSGYGSGWLKVQSTAKRMLGLELTDEQAQAYVDIYRDDNDAICGVRGPRGRFGGLWQHANGWLQYLSDGRTVDYYAPQEPGFSASATPTFRISNHKLFLPNGLQLHYDGIRKGEILGSDGSPRKGWLLPHQNGSTEFFYGPKLVQNITSALARLTLTQAMLRIRTRAPYAKIVLMTHDDIAVCVQEDRAEDIKSIVTEELTTPPGWLPNIPLSVDCEIKKDYAK